MPDLFGNHEAAHLKTTFTLNTFQNTALYAYLLEQCFLRSLNAGQMQQFNSKQATTEQTTVCLVRAHLPYVE